MVWDEGLVLNYTGFGLVSDVTVKTTVGGVEIVDGIECRKVITDRSNDFLQHFWLAQDTLGNVWQLRNLDTLTNEFHEEDVLYMPTYPKRFDDYLLWDITYESEYNVDGTNIRVITPAGTFQNCVQFSTVEDGIAEEESFAPMVGLVKSEARTTPRSGYQLSSIENFNPPAEPFISRHPRTQDVVYATSVTLAFHIVSNDEAVYQWYRGESGDTSVSITGKTDATFETGLVLEDARYWAQARIGAEFINSDTAILTSVRETVGPKLLGLGRNHWGQYGLGNITDPPPTNLIRSGGVIGISAGALHSLFITLDGTLWGMGQNTSGQLGEIIQISFVSSPKIIDTNVSKAFAGPDFNLYIKSDNTLWGMGRNGSGQLGDGTTDMRLDPILIDTEVTDASVRAAHTLYLKSDGTLMGMGGSSNGQLGLGSGTMQQLTPAAIDTDVVQFSAANFHSLYVKSDGRLFAMGWNQFGQLGDRTFEPRDRPVLVDTEVAFAAGGNNQSYYIKTNGDLYAMGSNIPGNGPSTNTPVLFDTDVVHVDPGYLQEGWYSKSGENIYSLANKQLVFTGTSVYSIGGSHTLYLLENSTTLAPRLVAIERVDPEGRLLVYMPFLGGDSGSVLLYSSSNLQDWIIHPVQDRNVSDFKLSFRIESESVVSPLFFQIRAPE